MRFLLQPSRGSGHLRHDRVLGVMSLILMCVLAVVGLAGCPSPKNEPAPTPTKTQIPTFTPSPPTSTPLPLVIEPQAPAEASSPAETTVPAEAAAPTAIPEPPTAAPTDTPPPKPMLTVSGDSVNVRSGPGVNYTRVGTVSAGQSYDVVGKSPAGDWWQICCVSGRDVWITGSLSQVANAELVQVAQNIPAPPPTSRPPTAAPPTAAPPPAAADPCAGIGGDGCKFKLTGGPAFTANGGSELKLTLAFVHGGRGDEAQGSYFVVLMKDGAVLPVPDSVRSWTGEKRPGPRGAYNYELKIGLGALPGNTVAGGYTIWVLDGNGERDSQNFNFSVPDGQGEVWIKFDQR